MHIEVLIIFLVFEEKRIGINAPMKTKQESESICSQKVSVLQFIFLPQTAVHLVLNQD